ncbi:ATPase [Halocatena halophila]|uniref:ATPase n=1 Tax=Halocatena halophila TaxID=2814576 RepID=UPI002ED2D551
MQLLVAGSSRVDAGKTTFSVGLIDRLGATGFKPRAGNDHWYEYDDVDVATERGLLYGKDARRLASASPTDHHPVSINPIHRLWRPSPGPAEGLLGRTDREFLVDRVGVVDPTYLYNDTVALPDALIERLELADGTPVHSLEQFNKLMETHHLDALERISQRIATTETAVVESYGAIARPLRSFEPGAVAVVEPRRARIYDGMRYANACSVASGSAQHGRLEVSVGRVTDLIDPVAVCELHALTEEHRRDPEAIATAYEPAYDALLETATQ